MGYIPTTDVLYIWEKKEQANCKLNLLFLELKFVPRVTQGSHYLFMLTSAPPLLNTVIQYW